MCCVSEWVSDYTHWPSLPEEISQMCTQCSIHPTLEDEGWQTSQAAHIDYPLENVVLSALCWQLLRNFLFLWWSNSLTSLSISVSVQLSRPPSSQFSFLFPPIQPFSSCHPWAGGPGGLSLWEVKGHRGWEGSRQVVWASRSHVNFDLSQRQIMLNSDPRESSLSKSVWNSIQLCRPYSGPDFPLEEKRIPPSQL